MAVSKEMSENGLRPLGEAPSQVDCRTTTSGLSSDRNRDTFGMSSNNKLLAFAIALAIGVLLLVSIMNRPQPPYTLSWDEEYALVKKAQTAESPEARAQVISQIEQLPKPFYEFNNCWMLINDVFAGQCWSDDGYDPTKSELPRDVQLLWATSYGRADIDNGGFLQFFSNSTGVFAPEMVEWFERSGLHESASAVRDAMAVFGDDFPRSREVRNEFLESIDGDQAWGDEFDPFHDMDKRFYSSLPYEDGVFENAADHWLREVCSIKSLHDTVD
jgi:hypothetical protein